MDVVHWGGKANIEWCKPLPERERDTNKERKNE
jgi:hypothetical protein